MNGLKNILVVIALLITAWPCIHADHHADPSFIPDAVAEIAESHHCSCHSCEETVCTKTLEVQQTVAFIPVISATPSSDQLLLILSETKPVVRQITTSVYDPLVALKTIQLLI